MKNKQKISFLSLVTKLTPEEIAEEKKSWAFIRYCRNILWI